MKAVLVLEDGFALEGKSFTGEFETDRKNLRKKNSGEFKTPPCSRSIMVAPKTALAFNS